MDVITKTAAVSNPYDRNLGNTNSLRKAIDAMCSHCMGCTEGYMEPGFREEIKNCTAPKCPLWHFRPYQQKRTEGACERVAVIVRTDPVPEATIPEIVDSSSLSRS